MKKTVWVILGILVALLAAGGIYVYLVFFEQERPTIQVRPDVKFIGKSLEVKVQDLKSGVAELQIDMIQRGKSVSLLSEKFPKKTRLVEKTIPLRPLPP